MIVTVLLLLLVLRVAFVKWKGGFSAHYRLRSDSSF